MLQSMTGYGVARFENEQVRISVEVKTLNSKFTDTNVRYPRLFSSKELEIRNIANKILGRGKVSIAIEYYNFDNSQTAATINKELASHYYNELNALADQVNVNNGEVDLLRQAISMPNVIENNTDHTLSKEEWELTHGVLKEALDNCIDFRRREGKEVEDLFRQYIQSIGDGLEQIIKQDPNRIDTIKTRIKEHLETYVGKENVDPGRFEQELIYYIEKIDISEEKTRLKNHLNYFLEVLDGESNGKKLGFIAQEIGREINTIGSKANDAVIQQLVVGMKDELEKIKEQVANVL